MILPYFLEGFVVVLGIVLLMTDAFSKIDKNIVGWTAVVWLLVILGATFFLAPLPQSWAESSFYVVDPLSIFFKRFMLLATALTIILAIDYGPVYLRHVPSSAPQAGLGEFFTLPVFACAGLMWMVSSADFVMIFVSLELVTITFYVLVASMRQSPLSLEAGVKYLILGALSTGFIVYGITWVSGLTDQTSLAKLGQILPIVQEGYQGAILFGLGLILVALGFKVAAVPFQFWIPDVYQGAPTPVTAFLSVASKAAGFVVLCRVIEPFLATPVFQPKVLAALSFLAGATLLMGNLAALTQKNLKRLLAYSSVAHAGYLLIAVVSIHSPIRQDAIAFYLTGYLLMTFLAFFVLVNVGKVTGGDDISHYNGLARRSPFLAAALLLSMLSLAGLPFTIGFLGKFFIFEAAMQSQQYWLVAIGAVTVASGFYYYLKVVRAMYWQPAPEGSSQIVVTGAGLALIGVMCAAIVVFGIFPQPILSMLR